MKIKSWLIIFILYFFVTISCEFSPEIEIPEDIANLENLELYRAEDAPLHEILFEKEVAFGDTDEIFIGFISGIAADENGRVFLADRREAIIRVYDHDGNYLYSIGGKGECPGEFTGLHRLKLLDGTLFTLDNQQQRISRFNSADGTYHSSISLDDSHSGTSGYPTSFEPLSDGRFLVFINQMDQSDGALYRSP